MTESPRSPRRRVVVAVVLVVAIVAAVVAVVVGIGSAGRPGERSGTTSTPGAGASTSASAAPSARPTPSASASPTSRPSASTGASAAPTPQPTRTAVLSSPAPISRELTAKVAKVEAVQGKAQGPGEIAGPAVRFTITITNATGKKVDLTHTVVNAFYGKASTPATELGEPGGEPFPAAVAAGKKATGVFLFNIPEAQRANVEVTVDTSVENPVLAFRGAVPK